MVVPISESALHSWRRAQFEPWIWVEGSEFWRRRLASARRRAAEGNSDSILLRADSTLAAPDFLRVTSDLLTTIVQAYPGVRPVSPLENLYQCPPGRTVRMPGSGCPIRDDGAIVSLIALQAEGDSLLSGGHVIKSDGSNTWAESISFVFRRVSGAWRYVRVASSSIS